MKFLGFLILWCGGPYHVAAQDFANLRPNAELKNDLQEFSISKSSDTVTVKSGSMVVAAYKYAGTVQEEKKPDQKPLAKPFLLPLTAPNGVEVTRPYPVIRGKKGETTDHFHQKSAWFCHGDVIPEGLELKIKTTEKTGKGVDFWTEVQDKDGTPRHGRIVCTKMEDPTPSGFISTNEWVSPDGKKIMSETRKLTFTRLAKGTLITFHITLIADVCPISFGDTKEGSFGIRIRDEFTLNSKGGGNGSGKIESSDGQSFPFNSKDNLPIWGQPANWHDYNGTVEGKAAGLAVFDHPKNSVRANWHSRAYGLMAANPFGRNASGFPSQKGKTDLVKIPKGEQLQFTYGLYIHEGDAKFGDVSGAYQEFSK